MIETLKFIVTADWHLRSSLPLCRQDEDWMGTQRDHLRQILRFAHRINPSYEDVNVFVVGDLFHTLRDTSMECITMVQELASNLRSNCCGMLKYLAGNHDLPYHSSSNKDTCGVGVLNHSRNIQTIQEFFDYCKDTALVSAADYDGEPLDKPYMFIHTLVTEKEGEFPNGISAQGLLDKYPHAKWIFTGDNHKHFHYCNKGRHVVNPGCLIRQSIDMKDNTCGCYYIDIKKAVVEFLPFKDDKTLLDTNYSAEPYDKSVERFIQGVQDGASITLDYLENVRLAMENNSLPQDVKDVIHTILERV